MDSFDFSPLFRSTIGFDHLMRLADAATRLDSGASVYPPYNIESTGENAYRLTMAVAGFAADDLDITVKENALLISAKSKKNEEAKEYLYRGIARRLRAALPARRSHQGGGREPLQWFAPRRPRARASRSDEAA